MKKSILIFALLAFLLTKNNAQTVTDYDGNIYNTVTIGTQVWLKPNLRVTHYSNGDTIEHITNYLQWRQMTKGAYCDYYNNLDSSKTYGNLYNWYVINDTRNICPSGWHVPTDSNWSKLIIYLGYMEAGSKLKEKGTYHWLPPSYGATNQTGFTALPGGFIDYSGFQNIGHNGNWWSSSEDGSGSVWYLNMSHVSTVASLTRTTYKSNGYSIRCLSDIPVQINEINYQVDIKIYPNPVTDKIYISSTQRQSLKMQVYNTVGQCVLQTELNNLTNSIDISSLTNGVYILKFTTPNGTIEKKLIKE